MTLSSQVPTPSQESPNILKFHHEPIKPFFNDRKWKLCKIAIIIGKVSTYKHTKWVSMVNGEIRECLVFSDWGLEG